MTFLLDINVIMALLDPAHVHHRVAHDWFSAVPGRKWATCPITENGVLRIMGSRRYSQYHGNPAEVAELLIDARTQPGHTFWADSISLLDETIFHPERLLDSDQLTDTYLLALAASRGGKFATFDKRLVVSAVRTGKASLYIIGN